MTGKIMIAKPNTNSGRDTNKNIKFIANGTFSGWLLILLWNSKIKYCNKIPRTIVNTAVFLDSLMLSNYASILDLIEESLLSLLSSELTAMFGHTTHLYL